MTSLGFSQDGLGGVLVDLNVPRDNEFTLTSGPNVMPSAVAGQMPTKIAESLLKVTTLHGLAYTDLCRCQPPSHPCWSAEHCAHLRDTKRTGR